MNAIASSPPEPRQSRGPLIIAISLVAIVFGLLSIKEGGAVLFVDGTGRAQAGNYVPFVVWFNFLAGFAYVVAGVGLWLKKRWAVWFATLVAGATLLAFAALGVHIGTGGAYEQRTVIAMVLRSVVWLAIAGLAWRFVAGPHQGLKSAPR